MLVIALLVLFLLSVLANVGLVILLNRTDGDVVVIHTEEDGLPGIRYDLEFDGDPYDIQFKDRVSFKVLKD